MPTTTPSTDRIEKKVTLDAPRSRVWRALTDVQQFNSWFGVALESPFTPGAEVSGKITFRWTGDEGFAAEESVAIDVS